MNWQEYGAVEVIEGDEPKPKTPTRTTTKSAEAKRRIIMYASREDMIESFGEREVLRLESMHTDGVQSLKRALADASERMNSYLSGRYGIPLVKTGQLKLCCCNIARYFFVF